MTDTATSGWAFLVARGQQVGYQLLLVPDFIRTGHDAGSLMDVAQGEVPDSAPPRVSDIPGPANGRLCVVHRTTRATRALVATQDGSDAPLLDRVGRPLVLTYGFVCRGVRVVAPDEQDMDGALRQAVATYRRFLGDEEAFLPEISHQYPIRSGLTQTGETASPPAASPASPRATPQWTSQVLPPRPRPNPFRGRFVLTAIILAVVFALIGLAVTSLSHDKVKVPDVVGKNQWEAEHELRDRDLQVVTKKKPNGEPSGIVIETDPPAGTWVDKNSKVKIIFSTDTQSVGSPQPRYPPLLPSVAR